MSSLSSYEDGLAELVASYNTLPEQSCPARITSYLVIGGLYHAAKVEPLQQEFGVTHIFSCIHSMGEMSIGDDVRKRKEAERSAELPEASSLEEAIQQQKQVIASTSSEPFSLANYYGSAGIVYHGIDSDDQDGYEMLQNHRDSFFIFCEKARQDNPNACIYVHCSMGVNRSACLGVAYVMCREKSHLIDVIRQFLQKRGTVLKNSSFRCQLVQYAADQGLLGSLPDEDVT